MAVNVAEFISVLRKIRDVIYPEVNNLYGNATALNSSITANKNDFDAKYAEFNTDFAEFNQDITTVEGLVISAQSSATSASQSATTATQKSNEIKAITAQSTTLPAGSQATASYNPVDGKITIGVPSGVKGDKGDSFTINAVGITSERSLYDTQPTGFSFLDITLALIYFKLSSASGNWSTGSPFGKGDKGDPGAAGNGISGIVFVSTTHPSGLPSQSGGNDTYRITYTNATTFDFVIHNGADLTLSSNLPKANGAASAGTSTQGSKSDHIHPLQTSVAKLQTARNIELTGALTGSALFDGSANINITAIVVDDSHNHTIAYVAGLQAALDGKLSTSGNAVTATSATTATIATDCTNALGYNQTYQDLTSSRELSKTYTNNTGKPIFAIVTNTAPQGISNSIITATVSGLAISTSGGYSPSGNEYHEIGFIIPNGATYSVSGLGVGTLYKWIELR